MPKLKQPNTLEKLGLEQVSKILQVSCTRLEILESHNEENSMINRKHRQAELNEAVKQYVYALPGPVLEKVLVDVIARIIEKLVSDRNFKGLVAALRCLLQPSLRLVDLGQMFFGARLLRKVTQQCEDVLPVKLQHMSYLTHLTLCSRCTDDILFTLAKNCPRLTELNISYSDLVTNHGLILLCGGYSDVEVNVPGCKRLEWLGLQKLWGTTVEGVSTVINNLPRLRYLRYDQCAEVFSQLIRNDSVAQKQYHITNFDQTYNIFTPTEDLMKQVSEMCPDINSVHVYMTDALLLHLLPLKNIQSFAIEFSGSVGQQFPTYLQIVGQNLTSLTLSFELMEYVHLDAIGRHCPKLRELQMMGTEIDDNENLVNRGHYFQKLEFLNISVWGDFGITGTLFTYFVAGSARLRDISLNAAASFLTDSFFSHLLMLNPLSNIEKVCIQGNPRVPLTLKTARKLLRNCHNLEKLAVARWRVSETEFKAFRKEMKANNYDILII